MKLLAALEHALAAREVDPALLEAAFDEIVAGSATPAQIAALAIALRMKGESGAEIAAAARAVLRAARTVPGVPPGCLDTCGTGGDGRGSFNVSTAVALLVAAAGVPVAKHGNRAISSRSGSADLLEALGLPLELDPAEAGAQLERTGFAFLLAPSYHPALAHAASARREIGVRTIFNLVGPLANPARAPYRLVGVYAPELLESYARALQAMEVGRAWVVHGAGGYDELTLLGANLVVEVDAEGLRTRELDLARDLGLPRGSAADLAGGDAKTNARILWALLDGEPHPVRPTVLANAAAALVVAGAAPGLREGFEAARVALDDGAAAHLLATLGATRP